jgi:hypothetical protein
MIRGRLRLTIEDGAAAPPSADRTSAPRLELSVMETVVNALTRLPDQRARERVARWAVSVLEDEGSETLLRAHYEGEEDEDVRSFGEDLEVSDRDLEHLFAKPVATPVFTPRVRTRKRSAVRSRIQGFLADVQKLARDWTSTY